MEHLNSYLNNEYRHEFRETEQIRALVSEVIPIFKAFYRQSDGKWPYELINGDSPTYPYDGDHNYYSFSTSAMILFALSASLGLSRSSVLIPPLSQWSRNNIIDADRELVSLVEGTLKEGIKKFIDASNNLGRPGNIDTDDSTLYISSSRSYGNNDPFTLLWILEVSETLSNDPDIANFRDRCKSAASSLVKDIYSNKDRFPRVLNTKNALEHTFPLLYIVQLNSFLEKSSDYTPPNQAEILHYLENRLHLHLSHYSYPNSRYDAAELVFAMEAILRCDQYTVDKPLIDRWFEVIEQSQQQTSNLRPLRPFIANEEGMALRPLSVEVANSLLRSCEILRNRGDAGECLPRCIQFAKRYTQWLFSRIIRGATGSGEKTQRFVGWHSEHIEAPGKIHLWETSLALVYLIHYHSLLQQHRADKSLQLSNLTVQLYSRSQQTDDYWSQASRIKEPLKNLSDSLYGIYHQIEQHFLMPRNKPASSANEGYYSMLLYGPPGTGKTTLAEDLAQTLRQPLITITPSDFTVGGETGVEARAKAIFDVLVAQSNKIILFDEIDRLILDRDSKLYLQQGDLFQFLTPGMLTKIRDLRKAERCIFIIATNFAERIDPAIKRRGRIDAKYLILPPDRKQREFILRRELKKRVKALFLNSDNFDQLLEMVKKVPLEDVLNKTALMVYGELSTLVDGIRWRIHDLSVDSIRDDLLKAAQDSGPSLKLNTYKTRFQWGRDKSDRLPTIQEPYTEFFLLLHLLSESGTKLAPEEREIAALCANSIKSAMQRAGNKTILDHVREYVHDGIAEDITRTLNDALSG